MSQIRIREFRIDEYHSVCELWKQAGLIIRPGDDLEGIKKKLLRDPDLFLVAEESGNIVGCVLGAWDGRRGWINHLAVSPTHQRKGVGASLIRELERRLVLKGALKVNAQVYKWNSKSLEFFKAAGYEIHSDLIMIGKQLKQ
ncbi:MAG TPA: GNAT family N-acetyltransferase [Candidatus Acidoferrales bacterium]|nr:GNAT family N-acetyltransferase [Candidatus Acidoferrales bacterium]